MPSKAVPRTRARFDPEVERTIGEAVKRHREARALTQVELARRVGISRLVLWKLEKGEHTTTASELVGLAAQLRVPVAALLGTIEPPRPEADRLLRSSLRDLDVVRKRLTAVLAN